LKEEIKNARAFRKRNDTHEQNRIKKQLPY
jgi:hypothetical protein